MKGKLIVNSTARTPNTSPATAERHPAGSTAAAQKTSSLPRAKKTTGTLMFGTVRVKAEKLPKAQIAQKAEQSTKILSQALKTIAVSGVTLHRRRGVPLYSAVPSDPTKIRRELNGKVEIGTLVNGEFQVAG